MKSGQPKPAGLVTLKTAMMILVLCAGPRRAAPALRVFQNVENVGLKTH